MAHPMTTRTPYLCLAALATAWLLATGAAAGEPPATADAAPAEAPAVAQPAGPAAGEAAARFVIIDRDTPACRGTVTVNGAQVLAFNDREEGADTLAAPLRDGLNTIVVTFDRIDGETPPDDEPPFVDLYLSPDRDVPENAPVLACIETDAVAARLEFTVEVTGGRAGRLDHVERHWADAAHTRLVFEFTGDGRAGQEDYDTARRREWDDAGVLIQDSRFEGPRLTEGQFYKPDGTVGGTIAAGNGPYREWYTHGALAEETPYKDGFAEGTSRTWFESGTPWVKQTYVRGTLSGPFTEYHENGKTRFEGAYLDGEQHGRWSTWGADGRLLFRREFRRGEPVRPPARTFRSGPLGFAMRVPEGFLDFPGGKSDPKALAAYIAPPTDEGTPLTLAVGRLGGRLGPEPLSADHLPPGLIETMKVAARQQAAEISGHDVEVGDPEVEVYQDTWRSRPVSGILIRMQIGDNAIVCRLVVVPLAPEAIQIVVSGDARREEEIADALRCALDSLDTEAGRSRSPLGRLTRAVRVGHVAAAAGAVFVLVVVFAAVAVWLARRRARREAGAAAPGIPPGPPTPPLPPPPA